MQQLGKYNVIRRLGVGGMAEVFLCKLVGIGGFEKHVVVKKIRSDIASDDEFITMFFDEARLAANLNHPNIIQVFEVDQLDGSPYLAMEYVRGATLAAVLKKLRASQAQLDFGHLAYIFAAVCAGLDHAHNARDASGRPLAIVHRDISPQNIIISLDGTPKIFDFGVAKARGSLSLTGVDRVKGKFGYMAPEQLRAKPVDAKADIYAVGVCMYEAVTGKRPFTGGTEGELYAARLEGKFRMPSEHVPSIPAELEHLILSAMASDPTDRPTALELQEALATFCAVGSKHASSPQVVAAWLKELLAEEVAEPYEGYSTGTPSLTSLPRSANLPPTVNALEAQTRKSASLSKAISILGFAAIALAALLVTILLSKDHTPAPVASHGAPPAAQPGVPGAETQPAPGPAVAAAAVPDAAPAPGAAAAVMPTGDAVEEADSGREMTVRAEAHDDDDDARKPGRVVKRKPAPVRVAAASKPAVQTRASAGSTAGSGAGSAIGLGSAAVRAGSGSGAAGSGSAAGSGAGSAQHVATQVAVASPAIGAGSGSAAPARPAPVPAPARITAAPVQPAPAIVQPGSLDAVPLVTKLAVDGSLTTGEVHTALNRSLDTLRGCYRSAAKHANQTPDVSIRVNFVIDEGARASRVRIVGDSLGLGGCAKDAIGDVRTRVAPDVGTVSVSAVVRFKPTR